MYWSIPIAIVIVLLVIVLPLVVECIYENKRLKEFEQEDEDDA